MEVLDTWGGIHSPLPGSLQSKENISTRPVISTNVGFKFCTVPEGNYLGLNQERFLEKGEQRW